MSAKPETPPIPLKQVIAWAFYDWANTGYAMIGLALIFPRFYKNYWGNTLSDADQTFVFGLTLTVASLLVAVLSPLLGSIAELAGSRKRMLVRFAVVGIIAVASLSLVEEGYWWLASLIHIIGMVSFYSSNIFFDSMLDVVATRKSRNLISGIGFAFGYFAGLLLIVIVALVNANPSWIGADDTTMANRLLFVFAAGWWACFMLPLVIVNKERLSPERPPLKVMLVQGLIGVKTTFLEIVRLKPVLYFLLAYLFYIDGLNTIVTSASNFATTLGFDETSIIVAFALVQVAGVPCAILFGVLANRFGAKALLFTGMGIYLCVTLYGATLSPEPLIILGTDADGKGGFAITQMYVLALLIGMVQGGVQALSRSYFANLIPEGKTVAYFGFYSMIGKSAAVLGPAIFAICAKVFDQADDPLLSTRIGFAMIGVLFVIGAGFLSRVHEPASQPES